MSTALVREPFSMILCQRCTLDFPLFHRFPQHSHVFYLWWTNSTLQCHHESRRRPCIVTCIKEMPSRKATLICRCTHRYVRLSLGQLGQQTEHLCGVLLITTFSPSSLRCSLLDCQHGDLPGSALDVLQHVADLGAASLNDHGEIEVPLYSFQVFSAPSNVSRRVKCFESSLPPPPSFHRGSTPVAAASNRLNCSSVSDTILGGTWIRGELCYHERLATKAQCLFT